MRAKAARAQRAPKDKEKEKDRERDAKAARPSRRRAARIALDRHIVEGLMRELVGAERQPSAFLVYLALAAQVAGQRVRRVAASYQQLADETGLSRSAAQAAVRHLLERGLLSVQRTAATAVPTYVVERPWLLRG
ncbi:MAG: helix-turn-helix domain-containing protein [Polyangia bacterium]